MLTWQEFAEVRPDLAAIGRRLLYQYGVGLAFLATVRKDGGPRLHPICPILHQEQLYCFVLGASPKRYDLLRDERYALHAFLPAHDDEEFYCRGKAIPAAHPVAREVVAAQAKHHVRADEVLFALRLARVLHTIWENSRQPNTRPLYTKWQAPQ